MILARSNKFFSALLIVVLAVMVLRGLVPLGFMPSGKSELTALTICSGFGERVVYLDDSGKEQTPETGHSQTPSCPFGLASVFISSTPEILIQNAALIHIDILSLSASSETPKILKNFFAQGPPLFLV